MPTDTSNLIAFWIYHILATGVILFVAFWIVTILYCIVRATVEDIIYDWKRGRWQS